MQMRAAKIARLNDRAAKVALALEAARARGDAASVELCEVSLRHLTEALAGA